MREPEVQSAIEDMGGPESLMGRSNSARSRLNHTSGTFSSRNATMRSSGGSTSGGGEEEGEEGGRGAVSLTTVLGDDDNAGEKTRADAIGSTKLARGSSSGGSRREQARGVEGLHGSPLATVRKVSSDTRAAMVNRIFGSWVRPMDESLGSGWTTE